MSLAVIALLQFVTLGNIDGLKKGVNDGSAAFFMWETFMTKPYHDSGELKRVSFDSCTHCRWKLTPRLSWVISRRLGLAS